MNHNIIVEGVGYRLRPVKVSDAAKIIEIRLEDMQRNRYINKISGDIAEQEKWIESYLQRDNDYYFVIENTLTGHPEGLIGIYDIADNKGEWGRWVIKKSSLAAIESVDLIFKAAFDHIGLSEVFSRTIENNTAVVSFHDSLNEIRRGVLEDHFIIENESYNAVEHFVDKNHYYNELRHVLERKSNSVFNINLRSLLGAFEFHHIGVATEGIEKECSIYRTLGYEREGAPFNDNIQGIKGQFLISKNGPRLELLENLPGRTTLDKWNAGNIKNYHYAYKIKNFEASFSSLKNKRIRALTQPEFSTYFQSRICFFVLPNKFIIELIESL